MPTLISHEDVFFEYFKPFHHPMCVSDIFGGIGLETYGSDLDLVKSINANNLWTVTEEVGEFWISPGFRHVNRHCYLVTRIPHNYLPIEFRSNRYRPSLTPIGLKRMVSKLSSFVDRQNC